MDNIHSGQSLDNFKSKGGTNGFLQLFATNKENGINYRDKNEVNRRRKQYEKKTLKYFTKKIFKKKFKKIFH